MDMIMFVRVLTCVCRELRWLMDSEGGPTDFLDKMVKDKEESDAVARREKEVADSDQTKSEEYGWRLSLVAQFVSFGVVSEIKHHSVTLAELLGGKPGRVCVCAEEWRWEGTQTFIDAGLPQIADWCCPPGGLLASRDLAMDTRSIVDKEVRVEARWFVLSCLERLGLLKRQKRPSYRSHVGMLDTLVENGTVGLDASIPQIPQP